VYLRCRLDISYPILEVDPEPAPGHAINVGPLRGRKAARELADQLNSLFRLRQCGRALKLREHPSAYGQMGRCLSPCLGDLDPNAYRRQLDAALALFDGPGDAAGRLLTLLEEQMREAAEGRRYERAAVLRGRIERLTPLLERLEGMLRAVHDRPRLVLAAHPVKERRDVFWIVQGRVVDWGPLPGFEELRERTDEARAQLRPRQAAVRPEEVDEVRIVSAWIAEHEPPELPLDEAPTPAKLLRFVERTREEAVAAA
jgi:DNA polymerase-3 subunit epsilon